MPFEVVNLEINGVILIKPRILCDSRGEFLETYKKSEFYVHGIDHDLQQSNESRSSKGVIRGLHYQLIPHEQGKLVHTIKGSIFDVCVDIRRNSRTYGRYVSATLTGKNREMLWIPPGFAHGFQALENDTIVEYKVTKEYDKLCERGIAWNDTTIGIKWPIPKGEISQRDSELPVLEAAENNF